jgi:NAD+ diphosphatase
VRYFGSQPWPFPNSLMIGFIAEYAGGELKIGEPLEIEDARWYSPDDLPVLPPKVSIARAMIDAFLAGSGTPR